MPGEARKTFRDALEIARQQQNASAVENIFIELCEAGYIEEAEQMYHLLHEIGA
jgi:hypothetical protein